MGNKYKKSKTLNLKDIQLIVYDFDGVMTDNRVILGEDGKESVIVNRSDGMAIEILRKSGIRQIIISKEKNNIVKIRAKKLSIPAFNGVDNKKNSLLSYCKKNRIDVKKTLYVGNDINDLVAMEITGYTACPLDAADEIKNIADIILHVNGGTGVIRNLIKFFRDVDRRIK